MPDTTPETPFSSWLMRVIRTRVNPATKRFYTQQDIATAAGITQAQIHNIVSGKRRPSAEVVIGIANFLEEDVNTLLQLAGYAPITDAIVVNGSSDPVAVRLVRAVRRMMHDKQRMAVATAMLEAMLNHGGANADSTGNGDSQTSETRESEEMRADARTNKRGRK